MAKVIVEHEVHGKVLFDTETQSYEYYDNSNVVYFELNGKSERYFENTFDFFDSGVELAVIPMVCVDVGKKGKRMFVQLIDWANAYFTFFNVEMINSKWVPNKIDNFMKHKSYFIIAKKHSNALNDFLVLSSMQIKKGGTNVPPSKT